MLLLLEVAGGIALGFGLLGLVLSGEEDNIGVALVVVVIGVLLWFTFS